MTSNPTRLPEGLEGYKRTGMFTEATVPAGLLRDHSTKDGVWGLIRVEQGQLRYRVTDPRREAAELLLTAGGAPGVVEPTILHHVEPVGPVRFQVEFFRSPTGSVPLCRFEELADRENRLRSEDAAAAASDVPEGS